MKAAKKPAKPLLEKPPTQTFGVAGIAPRLEHSHIGPLRDTLEAMQRRLFTMKDTGADADALKTLEYDISNIEAELRATEAGQL